MLYYFHEIYITQQHHYANSGFVAVKWRQFTCRNQCALRKIFSVVASSLLKVSALYTLPCVPIIPIYIALGYHSTFFHRLLRTSKGHFTYNLPLYKLKCRKYITYKCVDSPCDNYSLSYLISNTPLHALKLN